MEFRDDLPPPARGDGSRGRFQRYRKEAAEIRAAYPQWGKFRVMPASKYDTARSTARNIESGRLVAFRPAGSFEASTRKSGDGIEIWVRYRGQGS